MFDAGDDILLSMLALDVGDFGTRSDPVLRRLNVSLQPMSSCNVHRSMHSCTMQCTPGDGAGRRYFHTGPSSKKTERIPELF